ncbi:MAG: carboxypeptidase regulatory-like domain-containing protein [Armatimonadetes bacterium]|nr:carboxypeptidase regulatory-like domain-containing protein [Armatimonadota bacterium]
MLRGNEKKPILQCADRLLVLFCISCFLLVPCVDSFAQSIIGTVTEKGTGAPIDALVYLSTGAVTLTDPMTGAFDFAGLTPSLYYVRVVPNSDHHFGWKPVYLYPDVSGEANFELEPLNLVGTVVDDFNRIPDPVTDLGSTSVGGKAWQQSDIDPDPAVNALGKIEGNALVLPVDTYGGTSYFAPTHGPTILDFQPVDFDATVTFTVTDVTNPTTSGNYGPGFALNYRVPTLDQGDNDGYQARLMHGWGDGSDYDMITASGNVGGYAEWFKYNGSRSIPVGTPHTMRVRVVDNRHQVWIDGVQEFDITDNWRWGGGYISLRRHSATVTLDDLTIQDYTNYDGASFNTGSVDGTVFERANPSNKLAGKSVALMLGATTVATDTTDANGHFSFTGLSAGTYSVYVSITGYEDGSVQNIMITWYQPSVTADVALDPAMIPTDSVYDTFSRSGPELGSTEPITGGHVYRWAQPEAHADSTIHDNLLDNGTGGGGYLGPYIVGFTPADLDASFTYVKVNSFYSGFQYRKKNITDDQPQNNMYSMWIVGAYNYIGLYRNGAWAITVNTSVDWNEPHTFRVKAVGNRHKCWMDGVLMWDLEDTSVSGPGGVMFADTQGAGPIWIDDVLIHRLDGGYGVIQGTVSDATNPSVKLANATVSLSNGQWTMTDENGNYFFAAMSNGTYQVTASKVNYITSAATSVTLDDAHLTVTANFALSQVSLPAPLPATEIVLDTFSRTGPALGVTEDSNHYAWETLTPDTSTVAGELLSLQALGTPDSGEVYIDSWMPKDFEMMCKFRKRDWSGNANYTYLFHYRAPAKYDIRGYQFGLYNNGYDYKMINGFNVGAGTGGNDWTQWHDLHVKIEGNRHRVWLDGHGELDWTDNTWLNGGYIGFAGGADTGTVEIDDLTFFDPVPRLATVAAVLTYPDDKGMSIEGPTVASVGSGFFMLADAGGSPSIKVYSPIPVQVGQQPYIEGVLMSQGTERIISAARVFGTLEPALRLSDLGGRADGSGVELTDPKSVSAILADGSLYIEELDRSAGIKVVGITAARGDQITIKAVLGTDSNGERSLNGAMILTKTSGSPLEPLALNNKALGGGAGAYQPGITGESGPNNIGLLVTAYGKVENPGDNDFYLNDGSGVSVHVLLPAGSGVPAADMFVIVTGISSCEIDGGNTLRAIKSAGPVHVPAGADGIGTSNFGGANQIWIRASSFIARSGGGTPNYVADPLAAPGAISGAAYNFPASSGGSTQDDWWAEYEIPQSKVPAALTGTWYFWARATQSAQSGTDSGWLIVRGDPNDFSYPSLGAPSNANNRILNEIGNAGLFGYNFGWFQSKNAGAAENCTKQFSVGGDNKVLFRIYEREAGPANALIDVICWTNDPNYVPDDDDLLSVTGW